MLKVFYENGSRKGTEVSFSNKHTISLGRHLDNDCVFEDSGDRIVSGFHAEISVNDERVTIRDCASTNGLYVNRERRKEAHLTKTDRVELGKDGPCFRVDLIRSEANTIPKTEAVHATPQRNVRGLTPTPPVDKALHPTERPVDSVNAHSEAGESAHSVDGLEQKSRFGARTASLLIQRALQQAGAVRPPGTSKSTDYIRAMVEQKLRLSTLKQRRVLFVVAIFMLAAGAGLGIFIWNTQEAHRGGAGNRRHGKAGGEAIASKNRHAILMLAGNPRLETGELGPVEGFCTAFAVARDILATNAHCIHKARDFKNVIAVINGAPRNRYAVTSAAIHPDYESGKLSPDVGLVRIAGELEHTVTIAPIDELAKTVAGVSMFLYGFPGRLNREDAPEATFVKGDIGRVTTFDNRFGDFGQNTLLQHSAYASEGTSGSPIFNKTGHVIGINAGGYAEEGRVLTGYNFAMRIDLINVILPVLGGGQG